MTTEQNNTTVMSIDDGDNLVSDAWSTLAQSNPAFQQALQAQATAKFLEMSPAAMSVFGKKLDY